jgi:Transposase DDE domain
VARRHERKARLLQAKAEMEARAHARFQAEQAAYEATLAKRETARQAGKKPRGREPKAPDPKPSDEDQVNFTDPQSRIMKTKDGFQQCYNAQAGVETTSRLIVGARLTQAPNDKQQLVPTLAAVREHLAPAHVLVDNGFVSEAAITKVEAEGQAPRVLAAVKRERHGRTLAQLEKREDPPAPPQEAPFAERLAHRSATAAGRALYKLRQQTVEPVFGIIKSVLGFRRFLLRGLNKASLEWDLVCLAYNLKRLHRLGARLRAA